MSIVTFDFFFVFKTHHSSCYQTLRPPAVTAALINSLGAEIP
jgi:hypothetical protein